MSTKARSGAGPCQHRSACSAVAVVAVAFNLFGDRLRDALNPRR